MPGASKACAFATRPADAVAVRSMQQYTDLTRELFFENNNVKRFKTLVSMSTVKLGLNIPLGVE